MSKLCAENVGQFFVVETETISVRYKVTDESFAHEFGTEYQYSYEIISINYYIAELDTWVEITHESIKLERYIEHLIEEDL